MFISNPPNFLAPKIHMLKRGNRVQMYSIHQTCLIKIKVILQSRHRPQYSPQQSGLLPASQPPPLVSLRQFSQCIDLPIVSSASLFHRTLTYSWGPFGPLGLVLLALRALRPCDPRKGDVTWAKTMTRPNTITLANTETWGLLVTPGQTSVF